MGQRGAGHLRGGFTLIELLVVVAIIAMLISILLPSLGQAKEQAKTSVCGVNQRSIGQAVVACMEENRGYGPAWDDGEVVGTVSGSPAGKPMYVWTDVLFDLEYLGDTRAAMCPTDQRPDFATEIRAINWGGPYIFSDQPGTGTRKYGVRTSYALSAIMHFNFKQDRWEQSPARQIHSMDGWWCWFNSQNAAYVWSVTIYGQGDDSVLSPNEFNNMAAWRHNGGRYNSNALHMDGHVSLVTPKPPVDRTDASRGKDETDTTTRFTWLPGETSNRTLYGTYKGSMEEWNDLSDNDKNKPQPGAGRVKDNAAGRLVYPYKWVGPQGGNNFHPVDFPVELSPVYRTSTNRWRRLPNAPEERL
ncbi:MAG: prepilin-type N-terminal cleavage/methylation domain-containing protein [Phycisphaerae bacterium]|jgi:prepilin-type N-terminal cleavage/methylation domain-containing protein/prepilin-type processing-associated H-X9-DG protein